MTYYLDKMSEHRNVRTNVKTMALLIVGRLRADLLAVILRLRLTL